MKYLAARSVENDTIFALAVANILPPSVILHEQMEMDFSGWLDENTNFYCELVEVEETEWTSLLAFGVGKPYRIRVEREARFVAQAGGVETQADTSWGWTFHEAPDLEL